MARNIDPLDRQTPIVDDKGRPTLRFIRLWAQQIISNFAANAQTLLDSITATQGSILYRGSAGWQALGPGVVGQVLTQAAGPAPAWQAGGGGGSWTLIETRIISSAVANEDFTDLGGFSEILVIARLITTSASARRFFNLSVDNGVSFFNSSGDYVVVGTDGTETGTNELAAHTTTTTAARTVFMHLANNVADAPKFVRGDADTRLFVASLAVVDAVRILASSGNLTDGTIYVMGR